MSSQLPPAPDGSERFVGGLRRPDPPPVRGPAAGVPAYDFGLAELIAGRRLQPGGRELPSDRVRFQHASEWLFARMLDYYGVAWEYEPDAFPIAWDEDQQPTEWFRPDFYLPAFDTYIEITTSQQRLVTRKNRKLRLLRRHHPQVRCKLFYLRDVVALLERAGLDPDVLLRERPQAS